MTTIRDVAKACGLSAMTVSSVLNGRHGAASSQTRARVLRVVAEMGYHPNAVARGLTRRRMNTLGVVSAFHGKPSLTADRYFGPILDGILEAAKCHHQKILMITEKTWDDVAGQLRTYLDGHCDGMIFVLPLIKSQDFLDIIQKSMPLMLIGENRPEPELSTVDIDNVAAARAVVTHLLECGHRRIALLQGDGVLLSSAEREQGYRDTLAAWAVPVDETLVLPGKYDIETGYRRARALMERPAGLRPTALFCADDWIAVGALRALRELGLRVPEDVSLVGINDDAEAADADPPLTTVRQPLRLIGECAVETLLAQIEGKRPLGEKMRLEAPLIQRESVCSP